jgi:hypothetical protein
MTKQNTLPANGVQAHRYRDGRWYGLHEDIVRARDQKGGN